MIGTYENVELKDSSAGLEEAARLTVERIHTQRRDLGAVGIVGMDVDQYSWEHEVDLGNDRVRRDLVCEFYAIGTAVVRLPVESPPVGVQVLVSLDDLKRQT
jgi:uncharacterized protein YbjQ (UPF0145 family)